MLAHYRALLLVATIAIFTITLDEVLESSIFGLPSLKGSHLAEYLAALWKSRHAAQSTVLPTARLLEHYVAIPIDHSHPSTASYVNRYWINTEFYSPGGPVFVHDVGEVNAESPARKYLEHPSSYLRQFLKDFHGIGIVWEHRYYGKSLPYAINRTTPLEDFRFLNLNQSLADLPYFAWNFSHPSIPQVDLTPASTPWIMVGCSYSGMRAAFSRHLYPETFYAAYAASAPVHLQVNLNTFFDPVYDKLVDRGYGVCAQDLHAAMQYLDTQLSTPRSASFVKKQILGPGAEMNSNGDFTLAVANIYSYFQSYGISGGAHSLASLCDYMEKDTDANQYESAQGLAARYGTRPAFERLASWPHLITIINSHFNTKCVGHNRTSGTSCDLGKTDTDATAISWTWQLCSELGLFTTQNSGSQSLVSRYQSLEYRKSLCERQFPLARAEGLLPTVPAVDDINTATGGRLMRPSNVFWTAGEYDPWRSLTPLAAKKHNSHHAGAVVVTQDIPSCNVSTSTDTVFGYVMEDAQHCLDYSTSSDQAAVARAHFAEALRQWLPCFEGRP